MMLPRSRERMRRTNRSRRSKEHGPYLRYTSSDPKIASVSDNGKVKAKAKGKAVIYIQDTCGKYCKTIVIVK